MLFVIYDKKVIDHLQMGGMLTQVDQRILYGRLLGKCQNFVGHDAASSLCAVAEQITNGLCFSNRHQTQEAFSLGSWKISQDICCIVRIKLLKQAGCTLGF